MPRSTNWNDPSFKQYLPHRDGPRLDAALASEHGTAPPDDASSFSPLLLHPYPYQREILDGLEAERALHERWHNLVVMATGTGKTVVAALDYGACEKRAR